MCETIRVLIADDHAIVREGLRALITTEPGMELVGEAADGEETLRLAHTLEPDVILLDLVMPHKDGIATIGELKAHKPDSRVLVLTSFADDARVFGAIKAGALGYLLKDSAPHDLLQAIREVARDEASLHPTIARKVIRELSQPVSLPLIEEPLTEREVEILRLVAGGLSNQEIADRFVISERTVRTHVSSILAKLHLASRTQATLYALRQGIAQLEAP
jgi:two-component system, NarL family, response regulator LiaR